MLSVAQLAESAHKVTEHHRKMGEHKHRAALDQLGAEAETEQHNEEASK